MSKIQFQTAATPAMTPEEFKTRQASSGGKFITEPGTYSLTVKGVEVKGQNEYDSQWVDLIFTLANTEGATLNHYLSIPTTAERSFLFGSKKTLYAYNDLERFLKGFGVNLEYTEAMSQLEKLFSDPEATFVGKDISMRLGYRSNHMKYSGKAGDVAQYILVDKDGVQIDPKVFSGHEAAKAYAKEKEIKLQSFIRCLEVIPSTTAAIAIGASSSSVDLPF